MTCFWSQGINNWAVFKKCGDAVELLGNVSYRKGLETVWVIRCLTRIVAFNFAGIMLSDFTVNIDSMYRVKLLTRIWLVQKVLSLNYCKVNRNRKIAFSPNDFRMFGKLWIVYAPWLFNNLAQIWPVVSKTPFKAQKRQVSPNLYFPFRL